MESPSSTVKEDIKLEDYMPNIKKDNFTDQQSDHINDHKGFTVKNLKDSNKIEDIDANISDTVKFTKISGLLGLEKKPNTSELEFQVSDGSILCRNRNEVYDSMDSEVKVEHCDESIDDVFVEDNEEHLESIFVRKCSNLQSSKAVYELIDSEVKAEGSCDESIDDVFVEDSEEHLESIFVGKCSSLQSSKAVYEFIDSEVNVEGSCEESIDDVFVEGDEEHIFARNCSNLHLSEIGFLLPFTMKEEVVTEKPECEKYKTTTSDCLGQNLPTDKNVVRSHAKIDNDELYVCADCSFQTTVRSYFIKHLKRQHKKNVRLYKCNYCSFSTKYKQTLVIHVKVKHDTKSKAHKCNQCTYKTKNEYDLTRHIKTVHSGISYKCIHCTWETKYKKHMNRHIQVKHDENSEVYKCKECAYKTKYKSDLPNHVKVKHRLNCETFECDDCPYQTKIKKYLKCHQKVKHHL